MFFLLAERPESHQAGEYMIEWIVDGGGVIPSAILLQRHRGKDA